MSLESVASLLNVAVLVVGYYFLIELYREWLSQRQEEHVAGGRPQVVDGDPAPPLPEFLWDE